MRIGFSVLTRSWIIGKALHLANPNSIYDERSSPFGQVLIADRIVADLRQLNDIIGRIPLIGGNSAEFLLTKEDFERLKEFLKKHGEIEKETETLIIIREKKHT